MNMLLAMTFALFTHANQVRNYTGTAIDPKSKDVIYTEHHKAQFDQVDDIIKATTEYKDQSGAVIGTLSSDFTTNLTAPSYTYKDNRTGEVHGIRFADDQYTLFRKEGDKDEETKTLKAPKDGDEVLVVGCQGLHYYLRKNLESVRTKKDIPLKFLIPGKLDYYNFKLKYLGEDEQHVRLKVVIKNFFLRLFAPSLKIKYSKDTRQLMVYEGLSNIPDAKGEIQNVKITYEYEPASI